MYNTRHIALLGYFSFIVFALGALTASKNQYTNTLYNAYSPIIWVTLCIALTCGAVVILQSARFDTQDWIVGVILIGVTYLIFYFLPQIRGLRFWAPPSTDVLSHYSSTNNILQTGKFALNNVYPGIGTFGATIVNVTGLPVESISPIISFTYTFVLISGVFIYVRHKFGHTKSVYTLVATLPLLYGRFNHHMVPWLMSFSLIPLVLLFNFKVRYNRQRRYHILSLFLVVATVILHPMTGGILFLILLSIYLPGKIMEGFEPSYRLIYPLSIILGASVFYLWYLNVISVIPLFRRTLTGILSLLGLVANPEAATGSKLSSAPRSGYTLGQLFWRYIILRYSTVIIYVGLAAMISTGIFTEILRNETDAYNIEEIGIYVFGLILAVALLLKRVIVVGAVRINQVSLLGAILLIGAALNKYFEMEQATRIDTIIRAILAFGVVTTLVMAPFIVFFENKHYTETDFEGAEWHLEHNDPRLVTKSFRMPNKMTDYLTGDVTQQGNNIFSVLPPHELPSHFGYQNNSSVGSLYSNDTEGGYIVTKEIDWVWWKEQPKNRYDDITRFTELDRRKLNGDKNADKVYSNSEFEVYVVSPV